MPPAARSRSHGATVPASGSGYALILLSVVCNAARYHIDAQGLRQGSALAAVAVGSLAAAGGFLGLGVLWRWRRWRLAGLDGVSLGGCGHALRQQGVVLVAATVAGMLGGWLYARSNQVYGPELTAFLANLTLAFLVLAGLHAREATRGGETLAMAAMLCGAFLFSFHGGKPQLGAVALMACGCLCQASKQWLMKGATGTGHLPSVMTVSFALIGTWAVTAGVLSGRLEIGTVHAAALFAGGGILGSMLGMSLLYAGYNRIGVSRGAALDALRPLGVLLIGLSLGTRLPGPVQLAGGTMVLAGSVYLTAFSRRR